MTRAGDAGDAKLGQVWESLPRPLLCLASGKRGRSSERRGGNALARAAGSANCSRPFSAVQPRGSLDASATMTHVDRVAIETHLTALSPPPLRGVRGNLGCVASLLPDTRVAFAFGSPAALRPRHVRAPRARDRDREARREGERKTRLDGAERQEWPSMPAVAAYVRVSSQSQTLAMQRDAIARAAKARGHDIAEWYAEKVTGGAAHPPELVRLLSDARAGRYTLVYVYRLDRLSRRGIRDMVAIVEQLRGHGCAVASLADGFDLDGPAAEVVLAVLAWAAKMERLAIGERIAEARRHVEAKGGAWGRPRRMSAAQVEKARALKSSGRTNRQISAALKIPLATLSRAVIQKPGDKWGPRELAKGELRRRKKQGQSVDLRKTRGI